MRTRAQKAVVSWIIITGVFGLFGGNAASAGEPLEHHLVRGDPAAEAIIKELQALDPAAPVAPVREAILDCGMWVGRRSAYERFAA